MYINIKYIYFILFIIFLLLSFYYYCVIHKLYAIFNVLSFKYFALQSYLITMYIYKGRYNS